MIRLFGLGFIMIAGLALANPLDRASSERVAQVQTQLSGVSAERLARIDTAMKRYIDSGQLPGIATLVAKDGKVVHHSTQGWADRENSKPLKKDTIFRIYSMTKPITTVAALTLWEQGEFQMNDPIAKYLPELADLKVYVSGSGDAMQLADLDKPIQIIDLFMHTAGFSYGFTNSEVDKLYRQTLSPLGHDKRDTILQKIASLPLNHQPGTQWHYGVNIDIIGLLVEKLSGQRLGDYMQETIFTPLNMVDTGFFVPAEKVSRFAQVYTADKQGQTIVMNEEPLGDYLSDPDIHNAGGGLVSTLADYMKFAQMLLNGGEYEGVRILGRKTVDYMRMNHLPERLIPYSPASPGEGYGLGGSVTLDPGQVMFMSSEGNYGWGGMASTYFRIDPQENMVILGMTQFIPYGFHPYMDSLRNLSYQAIVD